jgi:DNA-binding response OmpR family regulator
MTEPILLLLVEDESLIREILDIELTDAGFQVGVASDGTRAIAELNMKAPLFRAVITDIRLGDGPTGWDVAHRARELVENIPIIYISGDSVHEWSAKGVPNSVVVAKPFVPAQIITAIAALLNKADMS